MASAFGARPPKTSSNAFASGNDQNCGNMITDTPTTRVVRPPGGASSIVFGTDDRVASRCAAASEQARLAQGGRDDGRGAGGRNVLSSNNFAQGSNQNCGNVMSDIPSTRVHGPPGGHSSISMGWEDSTSSRPGSRGGAGYSQQQQKQLDDGFGAGGRRRFEPPSSAPMYDDRCADQDYSPYPQQPSSPSQMGQRQGTPPQSPYDDRQMGQSPYNDDRRGSQTNPQDSFGRRGRESGNSFASGANQNCGNVMTGVPSTRVARPPGGSSSLNLSWDQDTYKQQVRAAGSSRGFDESAGAGGQRPREAPAAGGRAAHTNAGIGSGEGRGRARPGTGQQNMQSEEGAFGARPRVSGNTFASGSDQNCGNMLTDTPSTRVMRPPGGHSNFSLAWD